jgi:ribosomal protein L3
MGARQRTTQNLAVAGIRAEDNVILVKGCVAGANGDTVFVSKSLKKVVRPKVVKA